MPIESQGDQPNEINCHALEMLEAVFGDTVEDNGISGFDERIAEYKSRLSSDKTRLGITNGNASLTLIRDIGLAAVDSIPEADGEADLVEEPAAV